MSINRVMISATSSGVGKTTFTCGLLQVLLNRKKNPMAFKCGPDYIDPLFHKKVLGIPTGNLDSFFMKREEMLYCLQEESQGSDIVVLEGVMGYYDGIRATTKASSAEIAKMTETPVVLMVDAKGMAASVGAVLKGFLEYQPDLNCIRGVIFNRMAPSLYEDVAHIARELGVEPLGYLPEIKGYKWESRHLGLVKPDEIKNFQAAVRFVAAEIERTVDVDKLLEIATKAGKFEISKEQKMHIFGTPLIRPNENAVRVAIARDEAFCFYYKENILFLKELGCDIIPFSPIHNERMPRCDALILPGGYPELYAEFLEENEAMREEILEKIEGGLPTIAECGGFMYLHHVITGQQNSSHRFVGYIKKNCHWKGFHSHFGYVELMPNVNSILGKRDVVLRGHEFHYFDSEDPGCALLAIKPGSGKNWETGYCTDTLYAGFPHIHFWGSKESARNFVKAAKEYRKKENG